VILPDLTEFLLSFTVSGGNRAATLLATEIQPTTLQATNMTVKIGAYAAAFLLLCVAANAGGCSAPGGRNTACRPVPVPLLHRGTQGDPLG
jgi:hypothetical protein